MFCLCCRAPATPTTHLGFLDFIPIFLHLMTHWGQITCDFFSNWKSISSPQPSICDYSSVTSLQRCNRAEEVSEPQTVESCCMLILFLCSFLSICHWPRLRNSIVGYQGLCTIIFTFLCCHNASFILCYNDCKSVWVMRLYYFQEKGCFFF